MLQDANSWLRMADFESGNARFWNEIENYECAKKILKEILRSYVLITNNLHGTLITGKPETMFDILLCV